MSELTLNGQITVPKRVLLTMLQYGSLFGPTTMERTKHAQIPSVVLEFSDGLVELHGKRSDNLCVCWMVLSDPGICGVGSVPFGDVIKLIGGKDINGNHYGGILGRLGDTITMDIVNNQIVIDKDEEFEVSISLVSDQSIENYILTKEVFAERVIISGDKCSVRGKIVASRFSFRGKFLKEIMEDEKTSNTTYLHFEVEPGATNFRMKLGDLGRSLKRTIPLEVSSTAKVDTEVFNGIEAFAGVIDEDKLVTVFDDQGKGMIFFQQTEGKTIFLMTGSKVKE